MTNWKKINYWKIITYIIYIIVILFAITAIMSRFSIGGVKLLTVQSGSMEPAIKTGSLVFVKSQNEYLKGDIITFKNSKDSKDTITHRIFDIKNINGVNEIQSKGDANNAPDADLIPKSLILGKVEFAIPYIGYSIGFSRTLPGLIVLIIVPATIIIYDEISKIKREAVEIKERRKQKKNNKNNSKNSSKEGK